MSAHLQPDPGEIRGLFYFSHPFFAFSTRQIVLYMVLYKWAEGQEEKNMKNTEKKNTAKTYKQIIEAMSQMKTEDDYNRVCGEISNSFSREKITWKDYEILQQLAAMASVTVI